MRTATRLLLRLLALVALAGVLIGVPLGVATTIGVPLPSAAQWSSLLHSRRVDGDAVVRLGAGVFILLWAWFAVTAVAEAWRVLPLRHEPERASLAARSAGPAGRVRALVRFIVLSSVAATASIAAISSSHPTTVSHPVPTTVTVPVSQPVATPPSRHAVGTERSEAVPIMEGLAAAVLLSAGALAALEARRRRRRRAGRVGARLVTPTLEQVRTEMMIRSTTEAERLVRLDLALRAIALELADQNSSVIGAILGDDGEIRVFVRGAAKPTGSLWWHEPADGTWLLPGAVPLVALATHVRDTAQPCPALVHAGRTNLGEVFVDLEAVGVLTVSSPRAESVLRAMAASLLVSPFMDQGTVITVALGEFELGDRSAQPFPSLEVALDRATAASAGVMEAARGTTTFALRLADTAGEAWEPTIVLASGSPPDESVRERLRSVSGGRGLAVVVAGEPGVDGYSLAFDGSRHTLEPFGLELTPVGVAASEVDAIGELLVSAEDPIEESADVIDLPARDPSCAYEEAEWSLLVRLLGQVEVVSRDGVNVAFDRSKALELVVWLTQHRERPTRSKARAALWELDVRDATFANVVSEARRAMARAVAPPAGEEWIARTLTEELPLHRHVITDADLLRSRVEAARGLPPLDAVEVLRPGLELVTGLPLEGSSFLWPDAEGHTSSMVLLATGAAIELANHYLALGDIDGVFWATGQGLKVLSGHEELIALRMRAHAMRGDRAGVRHEWESYERALANDSWAAAEPAAKLVALRRQLLAADSLAVSGATAGA